MCAAFSPLLFSLPLVRLLITLVRRTRLNAKLTTMKFTCTRRQHHYQSEEMQINVCKCELLKLHVLISWRRFVSFVCFVCLQDPSKALTRRHIKKDENDMSDISIKSESKDGSRSGATGKPPRAHGVTKPKPKSGLGHLVGYIPNRGDFDHEWENDAELTLADMEFKEEDTKWERDLKLKVLEIYNSRLDGRIERKKFILERGLLERKEKKRSKEEREVYNNMRVFARFHSAEEHEAFIQGLLNEQRLRKRIEQLQSYRLNGIRTLADGDLFEVERRKRDAGKPSKLIGGVGVGAGGGSTSGLGATNANSTAQGKKRPGEPMAAEDTNANKKTKGSTGNAVTSSTPTDWDISKMPGHDLLSNQEKLLCTTLQLLPQHYLMIKERLIRECFTRGFLKESSAKQLIKIDVNKTSKIFDFFVSVGWLNTGDVIKTQNAAKKAGATPATATSAAAASLPSSSSSRPIGPSSGPVKAQ